MSDIADDSDRFIERTIEEGRARAEAALKNTRLRPIIQKIDGSTHLAGTCHYCSSEITPGHLFCPIDPIEPDESCSVRWEYEDRRRRENRL